MEDYFTYACRKAETETETETGSEKLEWQKEVQRMTDWLNNDRMEDLLKVDTSLPKSTGNASNPVYGSGPSAGVGGAPGTWVPGGAGAAGQAVIGQIATNLSGAAPQYAYAVMNTNLTSAQLMSGSVNVRHEVQSDSAELPPQVLYTEDDSGNQLRMTLAPEYSISTHEALQLMLLLQATATNPRAFSAYRFVKSKNLERHFKFEAC